MKIFSFILTCLLLSFFQTQAQNISVSYNYASVEKLINILESGEWHDQDFEELIELHGTQSYIRKLASFFPEADASAFRQSLEAAVQGTPLEEDPFMFDRILPHIPDAKKLLAEISAKETELAQSSVSLLGQYSPKDISLDVNVYLVLGIVGGGWTFDDEPDAFYVDLTYMKGDYLGVTYLSTHELYHLVQYQFMKEAPQKETNKAAYLLDQMVREGSATYVADFSRVEGSGFYIDFSKKEYTQNFRRMETNFALFETLLSQAKESSLNIDLLYNIGLSGMYQSPLYYVGYHMMKLIEQYNGRQSLIDLLAQSPGKLVQTYIRLCDERAKSNDKFIELTDASKQIIESLKN